MRNMMVMNWTDPKKKGDFAWGRTSDNIATSYLRFILMWSERRGKNYRAQLSILNLSSRGSSIYLSAIFGDLKPIYVHPEFKT
jgi:hypothetical protein